MQPFPFGRIHRIGQKEVCHLWNLLAKETREGDVYIQLLKKLKAAREALGDKVFDVLGQIFSGRSLREVLMDAVHYNERPDVKAQTKGPLGQQMERAMAKRIHAHFAHLGGADLAVPDRDDLSADLVRRTRIAELFETGDWGGGAGDLRG